MSVMKELAELLGVKMEQEFYVILDTDNTLSPNDFKPVKLTDMGLVECDTLEYNHAILGGLICGAFIPKAKTFYDDFKQRFPNSTLKITTMCVADFYGLYIPESVCDEQSCADCWFVPYTE